MTQPKPVESLRDFQGYIYAMKTFREMPDPVIDPRSPWGRAWQAIRSLIQPAAVQVEETR